MDRTFISKGASLLGALALTASLAAPVHAQAPQAPAAPNLTAATERIPLTAGRSTVLSTPFDVTRIAVTDPAVANATVIDKRAVLIDGKAAGTITLIVWGETDRRQYDIVVDAPVSTLQLRLNSLFPAEDIHVSANDEAIILSGRVSSNTVSLRAAEIAAATASKAKVVNLLQLPGGSDRQQVMLQVRFAEVSRNALTQLGASIFTSPTGIHTLIGRTSTQQYAAPTFDNLQATKAGHEWEAPVISNKGDITFSDLLNIFLFSEKWDLGLLIKALQGKGLFQSLAEPNLIAYNGQEASFLAGGEIPIPVVQGISNAVSVQWKEFGIRLNFVPTIAGDTIRLKVRPEVSSLDFNNAIILNGFRIPALSTRRAETDVELRDGQSFAIAGLIDNVTQEQLNQIPGLGHIPIIGYLFKSKAMQTARTELMVLITPHLVRPLDANEVPPLPALQKPFLAPLQGVGGQLKGGGGSVDAPSVTAPKAAQPADPGENGGQR